MLRGHPAPGKGDHSSRAPAGPAQAGADRGGAIQGKGHPQGQGFGGAALGPAIRVGGHLGGQLGGGGVEHIHQCAGAAQPVEGGQLLGAVGELPLLAGSPAKERRTISHQLGPAGLKRKGRGLGLLKAFGGMEGPASHRPGSAGDHMAAAAGEGLQQGHSPGGHPSLSGDHLQGSGQLLSRGTQHLSAAAGQGGAGAEQQMLHGLGPFIGHQHGSGPAGWAQLQGTGGAPGIPAGSHPLPALRGAGHRPPGHSHPLSSGLA